VRVVQSMLCTGNRKAERAPSQQTGSRAADTTFPSDGEEKVAEDSRYS